MRSAWFAAVAPVARRPRLWPAALRQARSLVPDRWWARRPFVPVPDRSWMAFRMVTAYGDPQAAFEPEDLAAFLSWTTGHRSVVEGQR